MLKTGLEVVSESARLYAKYWRQYIPYLLVVFLPTFILSITGTVSLYLSLYSPLSDLISNILIVILFAASIVITIWGSIALIRALGAGLQAQTLPWRENFKTSNHLILPVILTSLMVGLIVLGGGVLFVIPGLIFSIWYTFATYPVIFEGKKGLEALGISKSLVVGRWWQILGRIIIIGLVFSVVSFIANFLIGQLIDQIPIADFLQSTIDSLFEALIGTILIPLSAGASIILYNSAKENPVSSDTPVSPPKAQ